MNSEAPDPSGQQSDPQSTQAPGRLLVVIDGANAVYRSFFAIPHLRGPDGSPTNAVYGFVTMMAKVIREESPDLVAVAWDPRGGSFRKRLFPAYKANRDAQPEDLAAQFPVVREAIEAFGVRLVEVEDFEADDVIATLVEDAPDDVSVSIVSTDKDLMQLVSDRVSLFDSVKNRRYGPAEVEERFGVPPEQMLDLRSLVGDPSDNIPGVKGIGEKGAAKLISEWGDLETLLDNAAEVKAKRAREALLEQREQAELSKRISTLRSDVPLPVSFEDLALRDASVDKLRELYERLGFSRLLESLEAGGTDDSGERAVAARGEKVAAPIELEIVANVGRLAELLDEAAASDGCISLHLVAEDGSAVDKLPVGLALAIDEGRAAYVPLLGDGRVAETGLSETELLEGLASIGVAAEGAPAWASVDTKELQSALAERGLELPIPADDLHLASFMLDPNGTHHVSALALTLLGRDQPTLEEITGRGAKAVALGELAVEKVADWAAQQVCHIRLLRPLVRERLERDGLQELYDSVELPLTAVLSRMERAGVRIDEAKLEDLSQEYAKELARLEEEIYTSAGERFLISSPKQLQVILFEKLKLTPLKKTKTGYSTAESVLQQLATQHELPGLILAYRKIAKLKNTYIDALPKLVCERTGRIHPRFHQLGAATGRMSASHPNVQNIPIRAQEGARIREAFIPAEGRTLLSADYSQVELRILAHYSGDESLIDAFRQGEDIHRRTAAEVRGVSIHEVADEDRARAKAVNFGIIYGSSAFGLANTLGIATAEAQKTIDAYFERYEGVRRFLDETVETAKERGFVSTLLGRRRYLPDIKSRNRMLRQAAERMAVNTVIQGTAADLIKRAMVRVDQALREQRFAATMMLQVHDELVFELVEADVPDLKELVGAAMVGALDLKVSLVADFGVGPSWRAAH